MKRIVEAVVVSAVSLHCVQLLGAQSVSSTEGRGAKEPTVELPDIPRLPNGRSTTLGGEIRDIDPVLDRFTLRVFGQKPVKILFDGRTQLFIDGKNVPVKDLHPTEHASVQTILDGSSVFALSIHLMSRSAPGEYEGRVLAYNSSTGELRIGTTSGRDPFTLVVSKNARFMRKGQDAFSSVQSGPSDLQEGSLVSIAFDPDGKGRAVANQITVLATPGAEFVFGGTLTALDVPSGVLVLMDPRDGRSYQIHFNSADITVPPNLRVGQRVRVATRYDGVGYQARNITAY
jgi:cold shock CspA family protein